MWAPIVIPDPCISRISFQFIITRLSRPFAGIAHAACISARTSFASISSHRFTRPVRRRIAVSFVPSVEMSIGLSSRNPSESEGTLHRLIALLRPTVQRIAASSIDPAVT